VALFAIIHVFTLVFISPEQLLQLLAVRESMAPSEIWGALGVSRQGAMNLINPLVAAGLVEKAGTKETGRYRLGMP